MIAVDRLDRTGYVLIETAAGTTLADVTDRLPLGRPARSLSIPTAPAWQLATRPRGRITSRRRAVRRRVATNVGPLDRAVPALWLLDYDGDRSLAGSAVALDDESRAVVWDVAAGEDPKSFGPAADIELAADGTSITVLNRNGVGLTVFDLATGRQTREIPTPAGVEYWDLEIDPTGEPPPRYRSSGDAST